jgi:hypothetical protein
MLMVRLATTSPDVLPADAHQTVAEIVREIQVKDPDRPATLHDAALVEQVQLWGDLEEAMRNASGGCWSIRCEGVAYRIQSLALLVGPTPWGEVSVVLLRDRVYERVLAEVGIVAPEPDWDVVARCEERIFGAARG